MSFSKLFNKEFKEPDLKEYNNSCKTYGVTKFGIKDSEEYALYKFSHRLQMKSEEYSSIKTHMDINTISKWEKHIKAKYSYEPGTEEYIEFSAYLKAGKRLRGVLQDNYKTHITVVLGVFISFIMNFFWKYILDMVTDINNNQLNVQMVLYYCLGALIIFTVIMIGILYLMSRVIDHMREYEQKKAFYGDMFDIVTNYSQVDEHVYNDSLPEAGSKCAR